MTPSCVICGCRGGLHVLADHRLYSVATQAFRPLGAIRARSHFSEPVSATRAMTDDMWRRLSNEMADEVDTDLARLSEALAHDMNAKIKGDPPEEPS